MVRQDIQGVQRRKQNIMEQSPTNGGPITPDFEYLLKMLEEKKEVLEDSKKYYDQFQKPAPKGKNSS